jgi:cytochrome c biogenesis protein ResB
MLASNLILLVLHTTVNVFMNSNASLEIVLKRGVRPDTSLDGNTVKFTLPNVAAVETYIQGFSAWYREVEHHTAIEDNRIPADLSKVLAMLQQQAGVEPVTVSKRQSPAVSTQSPSNHQSQAGSSKMRATKQATAEIPPANLPPSVTVRSPCSLIVHSCDRFDM